LKKLLTALLVVAMVLSLASVAFAASFNDTADLGKDTQSSIAKLTALKIINGYPDGTFKPANNITRAEFAKIACVAGGMQSSADILKSSPSKFTDVKVGEWYTGHINLAAAQGWVKGFPDGTYKPNAQITYAEVITVLTRLLGYNDNLPGPWPVDYIAKAGALDITKGVSFDANAPATRVDVAVMADATLDCKVVDWDNDKEKFVENADKLTLIEDSFDAAVNESYFIKDAKFNKDTWSIEVVATDEEEEGLALYNKSKWYDLADDVAVSDGSLQNGMNNKMADILYNSDDEVIAYIQITSSVVTVDGEDWKAVIKKDKDNKDYVDQYEIDGKKYNLADWTTGTLPTSFEGDKVYRAWLNEDGEVYRVAARPTGTPAIVDEYRATSNKVIWKAKGNYLAGLGDINVKDNDVLIEKGGKFVEPEELKENDIVWVSKDSANFDYVLTDAGQLTKSGELTSVKYDKVVTDKAIQVKIDGTWYDVAPAGTLLSRNGGEDFDNVIDKEGLDDVSGNTVKYFLNYASQVAIIQTDVEGSSESNTIYGVVTKVASTDADKMITKIKVMKTDKTEANYVIDTDEVEIYYGSGGYTLKADDFIKFMVNEDNEIDSLTVLATVDTNTNKVVKPATNKDFTNTKNDKYVGKIVGGDTDNYRVQFEYTDSSKVTNYFKVTADTVIYNGKDADDEVIFENYKDMVDWAKAQDTAKASFAAYVQFDGNMAKYIFLFDDVAAAKDNYALVLDTYTSKTDDMVDVDINGELESYKTNDPLFEGVLYEYTLSGSKFYKGATAFDPENYASVVGASYKFVDKLDTAGKGVRIDGVWYYADDDTVCYDYSDYYDKAKDPFFMEGGVADINVDDYIVIVNADSDNIVDAFIIVNNVKGYNVKRK